MSCSCGGRSRIDDAAAADDDDDDDDADDDDDVLCIRRHRRLPGAECTSVTARSASPCVEPLVP